MHRLYKPHDCTRLVYREDWSDWTFGVPPTLGRCPHCGAGLFGCVKTWYTFPDGAQEVGDIQLGCLGRPEVWAVPGPEALQLLLCSPHPYEESSRWECYTSVQQWIRQAMRAAGVHSASGKLVARWHDGVWHDVTSSSP
jgi:hypothetical protein